MSGSVYTSGCDSVQYSCISRSILMMRFDCVIAAWAIAARPYPTRCRASFWCSVVVISGSSLGMAMVESIAISTMTTMSSMSVNPTALCRFDKFIRELFLRPGQVGGADVRREVGTPRSAVFAVADNGEFAAAFQGVFVGVAPGVEREDIGICLLYTSDAADE